MKLYIKANHIKILKNLDTILPNANAKTAFLLDQQSHHAYKANLESAKKLSVNAKKLFYDERELAKLIKGIYFGNSSCEHLLASITETTQAQKICESKHYNFVFVFPPISHFKLEEAKYMMQYLAQKPQTEVVVNDIGMLYLAYSHQNIKPILGLNFSKIIKNAFIGSVTPTELSSTQLTNQQELLTHLEFEVAEVREFYKGMRVGRFAIENTPLDLGFLDDKPKMQCDFYYPFVTLANSKACDIAGIFEDERAYFVHDDCPRYCNYASLEFSHSKLLDIHQRYNTVYKINTVLELNKVLYKDGKNRLVWEIFI